LSGFQNFFLTQRKKIWKKGTLRPAMQTSEVLAKTCQNN